SYQPSPKGLSGRPAHRPFRGLLSVHSRYGPHTRAATIRGSLTRRLQPFRFLHDCSGCFRLERLPGGPCTHWKAPPFHGARHEPTYAVQQTPVSRVSRSVLTLICFPSGEVLPSFNALAGIDFESLLLD